MGLTGRLLSCSVSRAEIVKDGTRARLAAHKLLKLSPTSLNAAQLDIGRCGTGTLERL